MIRRINNMRSFVVCLILFLNLLYLSQFISQVNAIPVIYEGDSVGSWEDTFNDSSGIEQWDNVETCGYGIKLEDMFFENFTALQGTPPDPLKWDIFDDGYVLWSGGQYLRAEADPPSSSWKVEMVQTNDSFSRNHTLKWRQSLQTVSSGMYYHFYISNASDGSWLVNLYQNSAGQYMVWNNITSSGVQLGTSVTGWHDYNVIFTDGVIEFYYDGVKEHEYDFGVESVKYRFGTFVQTAWTRTPVDEVYISSNVSFGNLTSCEIVLPEGYTWDTFMVNKIVCGNDNFLNVTVLDGLTKQSISGYENLTELNIDISGIDSTLHPTLRLRAHIIGNRTFTPFLHGWKVTWVDTYPPEKPTGLTVTDSLTGHSLILNWAPNLDQDVTTYVLYFSTDNTTFDWLCNVSADSQSFTHNGLTTGTTYYYKIAAADEIPNQSPFSNVSFGVPDIDTDGDGIGNIIDEDDDGDTVSDVDDDFPLNPNENIDTDGDGIGDHADFDDDNDDHVDANDDFPLNDTEWLDTDFDGLGNNIDTDDDNDGIPDVSDQYPFSNVNDLEVRIDGLFILLSGVNDSLQNDISTAETNILNKIDEIDLTAILTYLKDTNSSLYNELENLLASITNDLISMNASLSHQLTQLLDDMADDNDALRMWLEIVINEIDANLTSTNDILNDQLNDIEDSNQRLDIVNNTLYNLAKLDSILSKLLELDQILQNVNDDLEDSIEDKSKEEEIENRVQFLEMLIAIILILVAVNLVLAILALKRRKSELHDLTPDTGGQLGGQPPGKEYDFEHTGEPKEPIENVMKKGIPPPPPPSE